MIEKKQRDYKVYSKNIIDRGKSFGKATEVDLKEEGRNSHIYILFVKVTPDKLAVYLSETHLINLFLDNETEEMERESIAHSYIAPKLDNPRWEPKIDMMPDFSNFIYNVGRGLV